MTTTYIKTDGSPVPEGHCVMPGHRMTTFTITLRTMDAMNVDRLRRLIERELEVVAAEKTGELIVVR